MQIFTRKKSFYVKNANMLANVIFFLYLCTANCAYSVKRLNICNYFYRLSLLSVP